MLFFIKIIHIKVFIVNFIKLSLHMSQGKICLKEFINNQKKYNGKIIAKKTFDFLKKVSIKFYER